MAGGGRDRAVTGRRREDGTVEVWAGRSVGNRAGGEGGEGSGRGRGAGGETQCPLGTGLSLRDRIYAKTVAPGGVGGGGGEGTGRDGREASGGGGVRLGISSRSSARSATPVPVCVSVCGGEGSREKSGWWDREVSEREVGRGVGEGGRGKLLPSPVKKLLASHVQSAEASQASTAKGEVGGWEEGRGGYGGGMVLKSNYKGKMFDGGEASRPVSSWVNLRPKTSQVGEFAPKDVAGGALVSVFIEYKSSSSSLGRRRRICFQ